MLIDIRTLFIVSTLLFGCFSFAAFLAVITYKRSFSGTGTWSLAFAVQSLAGVLFALRDILPDIFSIVLANSLVLLGYVLFFEGMSIFARKRSKNLLNYIVLAAVVALFVYYGLINVDLTARIIIISAAVSFVLLNAALFAYSNRHEEERKTYRLNSLIFSVIGVLFLVRIPVTLFVGPGSDFMNSGLFQAASVMVYLLGGVLIAIGLTLLFISRFDVIHRHARAESDLRERLLKEAHRIGRSGYWIYDLSNQQIMWSDEVFKLYERDRSMGPPSVAEEGQYYDEETMSMLREKSEACITSGMDMNYDFNVQLPGGKKAAFTSTMHPVRDNTGTITSLFGIVQDITERKKMEDSLRISEESLKKAQEIGHVGSWHLDIMKNVLTWSDETYRIFGHTPQSFGATYDAFLECVHPEDRDMVHGTYMEAIAGKTPYECIHRILRPDGEVRTVLERSEDLVDKDGRPVHSIGITLDVTQQKQHEEQITRALREKEVLLKEVHHRVKNNLAVITSLLSLQSGHLDDERSRSILMESQRRIRSMALVHEKLYKSKDFTHIDVRDYIETLVHSIRDSFSDSIDVNLKLDIQGSELEIDVLMTCGLIINEILTNMFKHAFIEHESPEIRLSLRKGEADNVQLSIEDNGSGFPEDFEALQAKGIGLKLINILVDQINGSLEVQSEDGVKFQITFPLAIERSRHLPGNG